MAQIYTDDGYVEVSPSEFINSCNGYDIRELEEILIRKIESNLSPMEQNFEKEINKLHGSWVHLTVKERNAILDITSRCI